MLLRRGDEGEFVERLQKALNRFGFFVDTDGIYGSNTERAVADFQQQNLLRVDGIAGVQTLEALGLDSETLDDLAGSSTADGSGDESISDDEKLENTGEPEVDFSFASIGDLPGEAVAFNDFDTTWINRDGVA